MMKRLFFSLLLLLTTFTFANPLPVSGCVGKSLLIGSAGTLQQDLLAEIISLLIAERTGTSVKIVRLDSSAAAHEALLKADLDIDIEYTGPSQVDILKGEPIADPQQLFDAVKTRYNEEFNLVWLQPFGFEAPRGTTPSLPAQAAPVVRKDTLKKFPALARLVNKLGGVIDGETMDGLVEKAGQREIREVARDFLKTNRMI